MIGYSEDSTGSADRSGSHMLIVGPNYEYSGSAGIVAGSGNAVRSFASSVLGGSNKEIGGCHGVIVGGGSNRIQHALDATSA